MLLPEPNDLAATCRPTISRNPMQYGSRTVPCCASGGVMEVAVGWAASTGGLERISIALNK
jgi:hypothetical protein